MRRVPDAGDVAEEMHALYRAELARDEPRPTAVVKYAAEMRLQQKQAPLEFAEFDDDDDL